MSRTSKLFSAALVFVLGMGSVQAGALPAVGDYRIVDQATQETVAIMRVSANASFPTQRDFVVLNAQGETLYSGSLSSVPATSTWNATTDRRPGTARRGTLTYNGLDRRSFVITQSVPGTLQRLMIPM